ncbi:MAG: YihY/virulence factor BrkB family protein, partial [Porphyromonas sp.]|nr:YihY/virulence factor BrkB family protein [Porphyromonas sp.]
MKDSTPNNKLEEQGKKNKKSFARLVSYSIRKSYRFITVDMWRIFPDESTGIKGKMTNALRILYIAINEFIEGDTMRKSAALTYSTILSIVPLLAILISIAAAFGVQETVQQQLYEYLPAHRIELSQGLEFAEKYIEETKGEGLFIGIGVLFLLWAVISLLSSIEDTINDVWQIKEARSWSRRILGYLAAFILLPVLMTLSSGINLFISSLSSVDIIESVSLTPIVTLLLQILSFGIVIGIFTSMYLIFPNGRVHFSSALIGGTVAGIAFSLFQWVYISGMLWVTKYNAIYGSFAAIPLLLMYINFSWVICLFGAQLSYAIENISLYLFRAEKDKVSRRFQDFVA